MNNKQRLQIHQRLFHKIHSCQVCHDHEKLRKIHDLIYAWSFTTRASNGEASSAEVGRMQDKIMKQLDEL